MSFETRTAIISSAVLVTCVVAVAVSLAFGAQVVAVVFVMVAAAALGAAGISVPLALNERGRRY